MQSSIPYTQSMQTSINETLPEEIISQINDYLKPRKESPDLNCELRKLLLLYVLDKDDPGMTRIKVTSMDEACSYLEGKNITFKTEYNVHETDKRHSVSLLMGKMPKYLRFIGGSSEKGHYFRLGKYDEDIRNGIREYVDKKKCRKI